jgi:hypothetical protein
MDKRKYLNLAIIALIVIVAVVYLFPTETSRVKRQFNSLAKSLAKAPDENNLIMISKLSKIKMSLAETCRFTDPAHDFSGTYARDEIVQRAAGARAHFRQLTLKFADLRMIFPQPGTAIVSATATVNGITTDGDDFNEVHELECALQKIEGNWLLTGVTVVEVLKK